MPTLPARTVDCGEVKLSVAEAGSGGKPLLMLHGFTGAKDDFVDWLDPLAERGWWVVAPDHRGHGASGQPPEESDYTLAAIAADTVALTKALGWDAFVLLGHSMGGMVAQAIAIEHPERLRALVLMDTCAGPAPVDAGLLEQAIAIVRQDGLDALLAAQRALAEASPLGSAPDERLRRTRPGYAEFSDAKLLGSSPAMYRALARELCTREDLRPQLAALDVPVLGLVGEEDEPFRQPMADLMAAIPGARLEVIPGGGHSPQFEAPDQWWSALTAFLDSLDR